MTLIDKATKAELSELYRAPDRFYHGLSHVEALLALAGEHRAVLADPEAVEAAICFHDAIYDSTKRTMKKEAPNLPSSICRARSSRSSSSASAKMIEATKTHQVPDFADESAARTCGTLPRHGSFHPRCTPGEFDAYERAVMAGVWLGEEAAWRSAAVSKNFLAARTFSTPKLSAKAMSNGRAKTSPARSRGWPRLRGQPLATGLRHGIHCFSYGFLG